MAKSNKKETQDVIEDVVVVEDVVEVVDEEIEGPDTNTVDDTPPHVDVQPDVIQKPSKKLGKTTGVVVDCNALRLREGANRQSKELAVIPVGTKVKIDLDNSTESFYEVTHVSDKLTLIGFCVKEFIKVGE
jgi:hypothetical protein